MLSPLDLLRRYWGFQQFRPLQESIINASLGGRDTLALLPTGSGKSLCYQIPALILPGLTLVVSPLIALMQDQVDALVARDIPAAALHSGQSWKEGEAILRQGLNGQLKLLYVSPERLTAMAFLEYLPGLGISLLAVDEAHCISEWGHDFRPAYRRISDLREELPDVPVLALTATATPEVRADILEQLHMSDAAVIVGPLTRPNLGLQVIHTDRKVDALRDHLGAGSALIYCRHRKTTEALAASLPGARAYHGGLPASDRRNLQDAWTSGQSPIMVCTNAFGMGIDKADVRTVVHYDVPDSLESYSQEVGRAGRDGLPAAGVLLYGEADLRALEALPAQRFPEEEAILDTYRDLTHFLQIPLGDGDMEWYDFPLDTFLTRFQKNATTTLYALKALEQEELVLYSDRVNLPAMCTFTASRAEVERAQSENPVLVPLVDALLRNYPGILNYPSRISEGRLSRITRLHEGAVSALLLQMDRSGLLSYSPPVNAPRIRLLQPRVRLEDLRIDYGRVLARKEAFIKRLGLVIGYLTQRDICRSRYLASYFGVPAAEDCGTCDVCRGRL